MMTTKALRPERGKDFVKSVSIAQVDVALRAINETYATSRLDVFGPARDFRLDLQVAELPGLTAGLIRFNTDVRVTAVPPSCYSVCLAASGSLDIVSGKKAETVGGEYGTVIYPHEATYFERWGAGTELMSLRIDEDTLERKLSQLIGRPLEEPIRFDTGYDLTSRDMRSLQRALAFVHAELTDAGILGQTEAGAHALADLVTTSLLLCQPNNYSRLIHQPVRGLPGPVRVAREFIEDRPMSIRTVGDIADTARCSIRSLEEGFKKHLNTTPMAYRRKVRLTRARHDLQRADPTTVTVARIANQWGFRHLGRFAQLYRDEFDELPGQTLRSPHY